MKDNPQEITDAITKPKPLTLGKIALLESLAAPILKGKIDLLADNLKALYIYRTPTDKIEIGRIENAAAEYGDSLNIEDYRSGLLELMKAITEFFKMLPRPEEKKTPTNSATAG